MDACGWPIICFRPQQMQQLRRLPHSSRALPQRRAISAIVQPGSHASLPCLVWKMAQPVSMTSGRRGGHLGSDTGAVTEQGFPCDRQFWVECIQLQEDEPRPCNSTVRPLGLSQQPLHGQDRAATSRNKDQLMNLEFRQIPPLDFSVSICPAANVFTSGLCRSQRFRATHICGPCGIGSVLARRRAEMGSLLAAGHLQIDNIRQS